MGGRGAFVPSKIPPPFGPAFLCKHKQCWDKSFQEAASASRCWAERAARWPVFPSLHHLPLHPCPAGYFSPLPAGVQKPPGWAEQRGWGFQLRGGDHLRVTDSKRKPRVALWQSLTRRKLEPLRQVLPLPHASVSPSFKWVDDIPYPTGRAEWDADRPWWCLISVCPHSSLCSLLAAPCRASVVFLSLSWFLSENSRR